MASRLKISHTRGTLAWASGSLLALWLSGSMHAPLLQTRELRTPGATAALRDASPLVSFSSVALGGFRGIVTDVLWLRMLRLQDDGRYFEVLQLSSWITALEPDCVEIWSYQSWNMAYNVTEVMTRDEDRWRWVQNALDLLRRQGLRYNPNAPELYWQIGWMFQHKLGSSSDPAHGYYRKRLAEEMERILGGAVLPAEAVDAPERAQQLDAAFAMDPRFMREADSRFGALDWRLPESHALYWALQAKRHSMDAGDLNAERMLYQNLVDLFLRGTLTFDAATGLYQTSPDLSRFPRVVQVFETAIQTHPDAGFDETYRGFLHMAVRRLHEAGRTADARDAFTRLLQRFPESLNGTLTYESYMDALTGSVPKP